MLLFSFLRNFIIPKSFTSKKGSTPLSDWKVSGIIPTFNPSPKLYELVTTLLTYNPEMDVVIVDDCTPNSYNNQTLKRIQQLEQSTPHVFFIKTPQNRLKAGAINYGLEYIHKELQGTFAVEVQHVGVKLT